MSNIKEIINARRNLGKPVYNFGIGLNRLRVDKRYSDLLKKYSDQKECSSVLGINELENIMKKVYTTNSYKVENIIFGNGLKELLFLVQMVFNGMIYHITPAYICYEKQINILNKRNNLVQISTKFDNGFKLQPNDLIEYFDKNPLEQKLVMFNNPTNPTGVVYSDEELEALSGVFKKYNCIVLSDEIYINLSYENTSSLSKFIPERVIIGSSVSKDLSCSGYRLGWITFPLELNELFNSCYNVASNMYSCPNVPVQYATAEIYNKNDIYMEIFSKTRNFFYKILDNVCSILEKTELKFVKPKSAWNIFVDFSEYKNLLFKKYSITNSFELSDILIKSKGIVGTPGELFGIEGLFMRFSLVDVEYNEDIGIHKYNNIINGIKELVDFLGNL